MRKQKSLPFLAVIFAALFSLAPAKAYASAEADQTADVPEVMDCEVIHEPEFGGVYITLTIEEFNDLGFHYGDSVNITFSNGYMLEDLPYYNGYYTATGDPLLVAYPGYDYIKAAINNGDDLWVVAGLEEDSLASVTLAEPGRYLDIQNARDIHYTDEREDYESDAVFANFRNVAAGDIREGALYRSASPCDDQHNRASYVDRLMADAGVGFILNLSDDDEKIQGYLSDGDFSSPYFLSLYEAGNVAPIALNMNFGSDEFKEKIAGGLAAMAEKSGPYLIHCTEGKDRTGFVCMLVEALCGASYDEIVSDYMITYANYYGITEEADAGRYEVIVENVLIPMLQSMVGDDTVDITSAELAGYAEAYCMAGGMSAEQIDALRVSLTRDETASEPLSLWTADSTAREELISYVEAVTDESSADYIPVDHRVAVFDLDGTLFCETDPNYFDYCLLKYRVLDDPDYKDAASDFEREVALKIQEQNETGASFEGLEVDHGKAVASAFAGMTPEEFNAYIQEFKKQPMPSYEGMNRGNGWYLPMLQVVDYLKENDFTVYIVSGTDRFIVRGIVDDSPLDLPPWQIIGSDETLVAADQGETDGLSYVYDEDDALVLGGEFIVKNLKMNKVTVIAQEIGVQPVLSFGNSTGDSSMAAYVTGGNPYRSLAFMLCCDDTERENGSIEKADKMFDLCGTYDWVPVSMKNDWTTIYGDDVTYLGVPHPTEATEPMEILAGMTVEQKLAQMTMVAFSELDEVTADCLSMTQPGGILLFAGNTPSAADTAVLTAELQQLALGTSGIPLLISTDQEGGYIVRMTESTWFPGNMALAATGDADNAYRAASVMGEELLACGINVDFGPVVDVNSNPLNPVIGIRSFGAEPETVAAFGAAYLNGLHEAGVISSLKHFPGHGDTDTDSHTGLPSVDKSLDELRSFELVPFQNAIDTGADMVMTAHIVYPQVETTTVTSAADGEEVYLPATLSHTILTDLLRDEMGFEGVIVTDSLIMDAIADNFGLTEAAAMAINAGADILLDPVRIQTEEDCETYTQLIQDLAVLVEEGTISEERLDESVLRILELKDKYGILDREQYGIEPNEAAANAQAAVHNEEHKTAEREITEQAITLLKNDGVIPYTAQEDEKIVVLTAWDSEAPAAEYGMQTAVEAGAIPAGADIEVVSCDERRIGDISEAINGASLCIILSRMGSEAYLDPTSTTGAAGTLVDIVIDRVHEQGGKVIVVSVQLPYDTARFPEADAIIAAYNPTGSRKLVTEDTGETTYNYAPNIPTGLRMIFDGTPMTGTLPVSVPALTADYAFADEILYPAGFSVFEGEADQITCGIHEINDFGNVILDIAPEELNTKGYEAGDIVTVTIGDETWQMPYGTGYSDVDPGYMILVAKTDSLVLAVNQQSFAEAAGLTEENADSSITIRLEEKGGYLRQYEVRNMSYSDEREDYASDEEFANFRNIVMGDIPAGVLYRSASGIIDDHGRPAFVNALCEAAGIHTVIDLAQNAEDIEALAAEAKTGSFYLDLFSGSGVVANGSLGIDMTSEKFKTGLAEDLRGMLSQEAPYIIQCAEGKDRTGAVAMILEALMGASYDEMLEDYMASFVNYYHLEKGDERYQAIMDGNAAYLFMTLSGTEHVTDMEKADYQAAAEAYLLSAGLGEDEIAQLIMCLSEG